MSSVPLFPASLISPDVATSLSESYIIRPLQRGDYERGFLTCLADLTWIGEYSEEAFYERIYNRGIVGHIEEVVVLKGEQGKGLGLKVIQALDSVAKSVGCSKLILNCSPENIPFYEKCGYEKAGQEMSRVIKG
ncbi:putative glucosamine 6-phosphate n-acetyltransferase [Phaeomoniella chlamydospora]|uniref:Glucosamine 6-phosphate N-acetyltransferase n=1 Tax=Phaeomoniella chlamydospora TaxID=158046 RepID=A0A0G2EFQ3_PHACM|nr:putative glucosamine 6-phosphate n-acetyltransferase [Phaeomoniella chlamydospora]